MSTSSSGKGQGIAKARDPGDDNATEHAKHLLPDREDDVVEQQLFKLNEFLTEVVKEMYPFLSRFEVKHDEIEDMIFEKTLDWLENPRENASYSNSELEVHDKLWSVMKTDKDGAPKEHSFVDWCRKIALHRNNAANNAATEHADPFRIMVKDIAANHLTPAQRKNSKYKLREGASISSQLRSLVNVILRKNLGDAKVASYIFECGMKLGESLYDYDNAPNMVLDADTLSNREVFQWWCDEHFKEYGVEPGNDDATCPKGLEGSRLEGCLIGGLKREDSLQSAWRIIPLRGCLQ